MSGAQQQSPFARATGGALVIVVLLSVSYLGGRVALGAWQERYRVEVVLGDLGQGVVRGTDVKMRGVIVGSVGETSLTEDYEAVAALALDPQFPVPERAIFLVTGKTLLGEKQVEVVFDGPVEQGPFVPDGARIADPDRVVEVEDVLSRLAMLAEELDPEDLAVVVDDFFGAFEGMGPTIARSVEEGARAASVFARTLDDQIASTRDLSLLAEALGAAGREFNRLGEAVLEGLPVLTDNQAEFRRLLDSTKAFADRLDETFRLSRADIDRMVIEGDNVLRVLTHFQRQVGEIMSGIVSYTAAFGEGFTAPGVAGQAAYFQILLDDDGFALTFCGFMPEEMRAQVPECAPYHEADEAPRLETSVGTGVAQPEVPERFSLDALVRGALDGVPEALDAPKGGSRLESDSSSPEGGSRLESDSSSPKGGSRLESDSSSPEGGSRQE